MGRTPAFLVVLVVAAGSIGVSCSEDSDSSASSSTGGAAGDAGVTPETGSGGQSPADGAVGGAAGNAPVPGQAPLSCDDPRFANAVDAGTQNLADGESLVDQKIVEQSGDPSIVCQGSCTLTRVCVDSREALRIIENTILIEDSFLEATGTGDDHADVIQAYSPGSTGSLVLRNTTIRAHDTAATAGIFIADSWQPDLIDLENVVIWGGPYGVRFHADGYDNAHLRMKNVCFVGPFGYGPMIIDGGVGGNSQTGWYIDEWTNVNECTIENGALVVGQAIPQPD